MRYGIFSDVHSNLPALEAVLKAYAQEKIDQYVCAGDMVGYAAEPRECLSRVRDLNPLMVAGNHDWASTGKFSSEYFNPIARQAVEWTAGRLGGEDKRFIDSLRLKVSSNDFVMVHGTLDNAQDFNYLFDRLDAQLNFDLMDAPICVVGHTHIPGIFVEEAQKISYTNDYPVEISPQKKYIINVGSVGQPRDTDWRASYCVLDSSSRTVEIKRVEYDVKEAQKRIIAAGLPHFLAERLFIGR
jgi:putative phosphoesterase